MAASARPGIKYFGLGVSLMLVAGHFSALERELVDHRRGACSNPELAREENQIIKEGLAILRQRILAEAERQDDNLPPLATRIDNIFHAIVQEEEEQA